jgi:hypothetical protein
MDEYFDVFLPHPGELVDRMGTDYEDPVWGAAHSDADQHGRADQVDGLGDRETLAFRYRAGSSPWSPEAITS